METNNFSHYPDLSMSNMSGEYMLNAEGVHSGKGNASVEDLRTMIEALKSKKNAMQSEADKLQSDFNNMNPVFQEKKKKYDCFVWKGAVYKWTCGAAHLNSDDYTKLIKKPYLALLESITVLSNNLRYKRGEIADIENLIVSYYNQIAVLENQNAQQVTEAANLAQQQSAANAEELRRKAEEARKAKEKAENELKKYQSQQEKKKREQEAEQAKQDAILKSEAEAEAIKIKASEEVKAETEKELAKQKNKKLLIIGGSAIAVAAILYFMFKK